MTKEGNLGVFYYGWYTVAGEIPPWQNWAENEVPDTGNVVDCAHCTGHTTQAECEQFNCIWSSSTNACIGTTTCCNHSPPTTWAGNYLPDGGLYSSMDESVIRRQLQQMKNAGIDFIIASYWSDRKSGITKLTLSKLFQILNSGNNPHPNVKVTILYEDADNLPQATIEADIQYILDTYSNDKYFMKVDNLPVVWVYGNPNLTFATKWDNIRKSKNIYTFMKVFAGWQSFENLANSFYQYGPGVRYELTQSATTKYSSYVSPGFYRYHSCSRLIRADIVNDYATNFEHAIQEMANDGAKWHTIQTWNEWQESSGIEPASRINHDDAGAFTIKSDSFGTAYLDIVAKYFYAPSGFNWWILAGVGVAAGAIYMVSKRNKKEKPKK